MITKKKNAIFDRYPSCDHLNNALRFIRDGKTDIAAEEIVFAIEKAGGYFHEDVAPFADEVLTLTQKQATEILALPKEQEPVEPVRDEKTGRFWCCGNCRSYVGYEDSDPYEENEFNNYCYKCGRKVKWNEMHGT